VELKENIYVKTFPDLFNQNSAILANQELSKEVLLFQIINKANNTFVLIILISKEIKSKSRFMFRELKQVPFNAEMSNRENHHDKSLLISSKNQRDVFYEIFWHWEVYHKEENWNFAEQLADKIKNLVSFNDNFLQFIKLFQQQLILVNDLFP
jgi:hypothetical protein